MLFTDICILALEIPILDEGDPRQVTARYRSSPVTSATLTSASRPNDAVITRNRRRVDDHEKILPRHSNDYRLQAAF